MSRSCNISTFSSGWSAVTFKAQTGSALVFLSLHLWYKFMSHWRSHIESLTLNLLYTAPCRSLRFTVGHCSRLKSERFHSWRRWQDWIHWRDVFWHFPATSWIFSVRCQDRFMETKVRYFGLEDGTIPTLMLVKNCDIYMRCWDIYSLLSVIKLMSRCFQPRFFGKSAHFWWNVDMLTPKVCDN